MAIDNLDKDELRQKYVKHMTTTDANKLHLNAAFEAINDWFTSTAVQLDLKGNIDTATQALTPSHTFTNAQARKLVKFWLQYRFGED